ncbi:hypothetical protein NEF87_000013 [Candidatus Lokiarchaeum ossiferum]|uniref:CMP/dCMP-type deaminase domain-containing protein n=1 Tax=Candidatus Lokiarchaeum ossiferum TaxID=2951803 RepID=A0ABY6HKA6_9ARCH|nr:hypothetical protein NEF87_000013 [Candidatus Lokiarchaeum sp. B-35]
MIYNFVEIIRIGSNKMNTQFPPSLFNWCQKIPLNTNERPSWDEYFLLMAFMVSRRSSCLRTKVGAVIVKDKDTISTGYNGAPNLQKSCLELGKCYRNDNEIISGTQLESCRASGSHAESNAIALAAKNGHSTADATLYLYGHNFVCNMCRGIISNAHIKRVVHLKQDGKIEEIDVRNQWDTNILDQ